jgi:hypothetical protein
MSEHIASKKKKKKKKIIIIIIIIIIKPMHARWIGHAARDARLIDQERAAAARCAVKHRQGLRRQESVAVWQKKKKKKKKKASQGHQKKRQVFFLSIFRVFLVSK